MKFVEFYYEKHIFASYLRIHHPNSLMRFVFTDFSAHQNTDFPDTGVQTDFVFNDRFSAKSTISLIKGEIASIQSEKLIVFTLSSSL